MYVMYSSLSLSLSLSLSPLIVKLVNVIFPTSWLVWYLNTSMFLQRDMHSACIEDYIAFSDNYVGSQGFI